MNKKIKMHLEDLYFFVDKLKEAVKSKEEDFIEANVYNIGNCIDKLKFALEVKSDGN